MTVMASTRQAYIVLAISNQEYLNFYSGSAKNVMTTSSDGRRIKFPANILRPYVTRDGIHGHFVIQFDEDNKFVSIEKVSG